MKLRVVATMLLVHAIVPVGGCASSVPPPRPTAPPFDTVRRVAVVAAGDSKFTVVEHRSEPGRTLFSRRYVGIERGQVDTASEGAARDVMDAALARTMHDLATDPTLVAALATLPSAEPPR